MMSSPDAAFAAARSAIPDGMSRSELGAHVADLRAIRAWVDAAEVRATRRGRVLELAGRAGSPTAVNERQGGRSGREARAVTHRESICAQMPGLEAAWGEGHVSAGHVDAVAAAVRRLDDDGQAELVQLGDAIVTEAARSTVDEFERSVRELARHIATSQPGSSDADELDAQRRQSKVERWVDRTTGMHITKLALDPLRDTKLWTAIGDQLRSDRAADGNAKTPWAQLQVDAFVNAVSRPAATSNERARPEVSVLVDFTRLVDGLRGTGVCETVDGVDLPASTVRRLCCDADVVPIVLGGEGEVLDVGRSRRTATRAQRRALAAMHRTCAYPECTVGFTACRMHHVRFWWEHRGRSDLDNFLPLCERHHHLVHEGGWTVSMASDRVATWVRPDGSEHWVGATVDRTPPPRTLLEGRHTRPVRSERPMLC